MDNAAEGRDLSAPHVLSTAASCTVRYGLALSAAGRSTAPLRPYSTDCFFAKHISGPFGRDPIQ
jgi:hypothetical protein